VDWFNAVDATYQADLRDLIKIQVQRFDSKLEQRLAETRADLRAEIGQVRAEMGVGFAQVRTDMAGLCAELIKWMFLFWLGFVGATLLSILTR
jgi:hypothetical protein